ncbi:MAG: helix-turn-helix transcriptional regulator [Flavobacteriaceae bacterium]
MTEINVHPGSKTSIIELIAQHFGIPNAQDEIKHETKESLIHAHELSLEEGLSMNLVQFKLPQNFIINRNPKKIDQQTLLTISNFSTHHKDNRPNEINRDSKDFQINLTNSSNQTSIEIPSGMHVQFMTFKIHNSVFTNFENQGLEIFKKLIQNEQAFSLCHFTPEKIKLTVQKMFSIVGPKDWVRIMRKALAFELLADIYLLMHSKEPIEHKKFNPHDLNRLLDIQSYIIKNLNQSISVNTLAQNFSLSEGTLHKIFKSILQMSPHQFVIRERLKKSKDLLQSTDTPVNTIAYDLAFSSPSHFIYNFKKQFGQTPANFRKDQFAST